MAAELNEAMARILEACRKAGKKCGVYASDGEQAKGYAGQGYDMISVSTDYTALDYISKQQLSISLGGSSPEKGGSY